VYGHGEDIPCMVRRRLIKSDRTPVIGDWVLFTKLDDGSGVIEDVLDRVSSITRAAAGPKPRPQVLLANLDQLIVVVSLAEPEPNPRLIDRFLVMAEFSGISSLIVWNKTDLVVQERTPLTIRYQDIGYPGLFTCALTGDGVDKLQAGMAGKTSMFIGASGVGKTSLLNQLSPDLGRKVAEVSRATGKGTHATSGTEIFPLLENTYIADSPGVREFALWGMAPLELGQCFREFEPFIDHCRFRDCLHDQEVGCEVKAAVRRGEIDWERWDSYLRILHSL
jgi:ribosome biogenesis GTPase